MILLRRTVLALFMTSWVSCRSSAPDPGRALDLRCSLVAVASTDPAGAWRVRWELANEGAAAVSVLAWQTPLEGFRGPQFEIAREGVEVTYLGPVVKRGDPGADSYVRLPAGSVVSREVDLAEAYEMAAPGRYRIRFGGGLADVVPDGAALPRTRDQFEPMALQCPVVEITRPR